MTFNAFNTGHLSLKIQSSIFSFEQIEKMAGSEIQKKIRCRKGEKVNFAQFKKYPIRGHSDFDAGILNAIEKLEIPDNNVGVYVYIDICLYDEFDDDILLSSSTLKRMRKCGVQLQFDLF